MPGMERQAMYERWKAAYRTQLVDKLSQAVRDQIRVQKQAEVSMSPCYLALWLHRILAMLNLQQRLHAQQWHAYSSDLDAWVQALRHSVQHRVLSAASVIGMTTSGVTRADPVPQW